MKIRWKNIKKPGQIGEWRGALLCREIKKNLWEVRQNWDDPLRLYIPKLDTEFAYESNWKSDGPSIPELVCILFGRKREDFLKSGFLHDNGYDHAGLYARTPGGEWRFESLDKESCDTLLRVGVRAEKAKRWQEDLIYWGVRTTFGRQAWRECRAIEKQKGSRQAGGTR